MGTILLTGGGGYIGSVLAAELLGAGHDVRIVDRFFFGRDLLAPLVREGRRPSLIKGDTRSIDPGVFDGVAVVIHLADISNDPAADLDRSVTEDINLRGALNVARTAKRAGVPRFIFSSSCSVYGSAQEPIVAETSPLCPVSLYAETKVAAERALLGLADADFCVTILRNATVYGLSYRMRFDLVVNLMTLHAFKSRKIFIMGGGKQWRPVIHIRDLTRVFQVVAAAPHDQVQMGIFNVGSDEQNYQIQTIANIVRDIVPETEIIVAPDDPDKRSYRVSFQKLKDTFGLSPTKSVKDGVVEIWDALRSGEVEDGRVTRTVDYYRYLLEAERVVNEVSLDGRIF